MPCPYDRLKVYTTNLVGYYQPTRLVVTYEVGGVVDITRPQTTYEVGVLVA